MTSSDGPGGAMLQRRAADRAEGLPSAELTHPFGPNWDVYKVRGKVFLLLPLVHGEPIAIVKTAPADGDALRQEFSGITPGYHMNKKHWISLHPDGSLPDDLVEELVTESYRLVVDTLPRRIRPVDPNTFGIPPIE